MKNLIQVLEASQGNLKFINPKLIGKIIYLVLTIHILSTYVYAQPTLRKGFALEANYFNNGATSDWIFAIAMNPDCIHYITGGYTLQERDTNNNIPFIKVALISKINPESEAIIWQKEVNLTHYESMTDQEDETQAAVENLKIINNEIVFTGTETVR